MYCRKCGRQLLDDSVFCGYCGTKVEMDTQENPEYDTETSNSSAIEAEANDNRDSISSSPEREESDDSRISGQELERAIAQKHSKAPVIILVLLAAAVIGYLIWSLKTGNDPTGIVERLGLNPQKKQAAESVIKDSEAADSEAAIVQTEEQTEVIAEPATETQIESISSDEIIVAGADIKTDDEARAALKDLWEQACTCVRNGDTAGFAQLYKGEQSFIDKMYAEFRDVILPEENEYPTTQFGVVQDDGTYFVGLIERSVSSGTKQTSSSWMCRDRTITFSYSDGEWRFDGTDEVRKALEKAYIHNIPEAAIQAFENGRNFMLFGDDYELRWADTTLVIPMNIGGKIYCMWENEDGSLGLLLYLSNGTDTITSFSTTEVIVESSNLGTMVDKDFGGEMLAPNSARNYVLTIPREDLPVDISADWGEVSTNVHTTYPN